MAFSDYREGFLKKKKRIRRGIEEQEQSKHSTGREERHSLSNLSWKRSQRIWIVKYFMSPFISLEEIIW